jgi:hypothetical protein
LPLVHLLIYCLLKSIPFTFYYLFPFISIIYLHFEFQKAHQKVLSAQAVSATLHPSSALPPASLAQAQRQRLEQQLYSMRKPNTPSSMMDELVAAAALVFAANPAEAEGANAVLMAAQNARHQAPESALTPGHSTAASSSVQPNENAGQPESSRPSSRLSGPKRPTSTASAKRPLSVLGPQQQQLNGPNSKMMKLDEGDYKYAFIVFF